MPTTSHNVREPRVLYKYMSAERAIEVLPEGGNRALRATQPASLNDPLECATRCAAIYPSNDVEVREITDALNSIVPEHPLKNSDVQLSLRQLGSQAWNDLFRGQLSRRLGVVSFSESALHPLLWAHYADSGAGIVIGYCVSMLKKIVTGYERLDTVQYYDEPPFNFGHIVFQDEENLHAVLLTKASYWKYEQEWRLTLELKHTVGTGKNDQNRYPINICPIPNEAVTEVYFTERSPRYTIETINARLQNPINRFQAEVSQKLVLASDEYGYKTLEIV